MQRDLSLAAIVVLVVFGVCFAAVKAHPLTPPQPTPPIATATVPGPPATAAAPVGPVIMHVNGEPVTEGEFELFIGSLPDQYRAMAGNPLVRRQLAEQFVRMKVLEQEGRKLGGDRDPEVAAKMNFGHTNVLVEYALKKIANEPNDAKMRAEYDKNKAALPMLTDLAHIVVAVQGGQIPPRNGQPLQPVQAIQKASQIVTKIRGGMPFEEAARQYSDDEGSASQGGKLGTMQPGALPGELQSVIDQIQPGQISGPIRSQLGVHIFKVLGRHPASYEEVKPMLARKLQQDVVQDEVERLHKNAKVELDPKFFPPQPPPAAQPGMASPRRGPA